MGRLKLRSEKRARVLRCEPHGKTRWEGHVVCASCSKIWASPEVEYESAISETVPAAPEFCTCMSGVTRPDGSYEETRLLPDPDDKAVLFSARVACARCARKKAYADATARQ